MKGGIRIRLPLEAVIVLETLYREGMTTNKRTDLVQKAVETTGLDRVKVKNWIQNRRGKARRRDPNYATQKPAPTPNFTMSTAAMKPLSLGSSPTRLYKRHRSASTGSLNLHHPHPQFLTPFKLKNVDMQQDRKHLAEKSWAEVSQALAALSYHGYHFVCSVYSPEDNFTAVRSSGYGATFLSTIQGDKGVENLWKAAEVLEESKKRTANLIANVRPTSRSLPEGTNSSKRSMSESESENDREDYDSEEDEDDSEEADEESKEMNASTLSSGYDHHRANPNPQRLSTHSAPAESGSVPKVVGSVIKRPSSASSTSAALTLAALADAVFATSSADRRDVNPKEPGAALAPIVRPKNTAENAGAGTKLDRFGNNDSNLTKLPSPSDIVSISFPTGQLASQPPGQSPGYRTHVSPTAKPHPSPAWNIAGSVLLNKQGAKPSFSHPLQNRDISLPGQPGPQPYPYASGTERNQMMENNILPLPNIQYNTTAVNDASAKHGRFGGMAP